MRQVRKIQLINNEAIRAFFGNLIDSVRVGSIPAYAFMEFKEYPMSTGEIDNMMTVPTDTTIVVTPNKNPTTSKKHTKNGVAKKRVFDFNGIQTVQVVEAWEYDLFTGETKITIDYIAPMRDVYASQTGEYRGMSAMFWIKWEKMAQFLDRYEDKEVADYVYNIIWENYFKGRKKTLPTTNEKTNGGTLLKRIVTTRVKYKQDTNILANRIGIWSSWEEMSLPGILYDTLMGGRVKAYADVAGPLGKELNKAELKELLTKTDTEIVIDPIDQSEVMRLKTANIMNYVSSYSVISEWVFNFRAGKMSIRNLYVAPEVMQHDQSGVIQEDAQFWMQWKDVFKATRDYNSYYPEDNLEVWLWYDKFYPAGR